MDDSTQRKNSKKLNIVAIKWINSKTNTLTTTTAVLKILLQNMKQSKLLWKANKNLKTKNQHEQLYGIIQ